MGIESPISRKIISQIPFQKIFVVLQYDLILLVTDI